MDIDPDWVFLPDKGFLDTNRDDEEKIHGGKRNSDSKLVFLTDYFTKEEQPPPASGSSRRVPKKIVPVSFQLEPRIIEASGNELPKQPPMIAEKIEEHDFGSVEGDDKEVKTQVLFRKSPTYNESVDMTNKLNSPKSTPCGVVPEIDATGRYNFDEKIGVLKNKGSPRKKDLVEKKVEKKEDASWEDNSGGAGGLNLWKWSLTGIGAICSFGVAAAAATFYVIILGSQQRHSQQEQNQKLIFKRYTDDKGMKQVVHRTTTLNEAISAVRVPITGAHITFGGYHNGL